MARKSLSLSVSIVRLVLAPFMRGVEGADNLPGGPYIVAANHAGLLDGAVLVTALAWITFRPHHGILIAQPFRHWLYGWFLRSSRCIPLRKASPRGSEEMLQTALAYLQMGEPLIILPEGHIGSAAQLRRLRPGTALLALESGAPIVPVGLLGTSEVLPLDQRRPNWGRRIRLRIGAPLYFPEAHAHYHQLQAPERRSLINTVLQRLGDALAPLCGKEPPPLPTRRRRS